MVTTTLSKQGVMGDLKYKIYTITDVSAADTVATGLRNIYVKNWQSSENTTGVELDASGGTITFTSVGTDNDNGELFVLGR